MCFPSAGKEANQASTRAGRGTGSSRATLLPLAHKPKLEKLFLEARRGSRRPTQAGLSVAGSASFCCGSSGVEFPHVSAATRAFIFTTQKHKRVAPGGLYVGSNGLMVPVGLNGHLISCSFD